LGVTGGGGSAYTIASVGGNQPITLAPNGTGEINLTKNTKLSANQKLTFMSSDANPAHYISFRGGNIGVGLDLVWPAAAGAAGQVMVLDGAGTSLEWASIATAPGGATTVDAVARYSNTAGGLKNSILVVSDAGEATGLISCVIGDIRIGTVDSQTISTNGAVDLIVAPTGNGALNVRGNVLVAPSNAFQRHLRLYNAGGTFYTGLQSDSATAANAIWSLPSAFPATPGILKSSAAGVMSVDALAAAAGPLRASAGGVVSVNNFATVANQLAKYSDTVATFAASGTYLDANNNLSVGTTSIAGGGVTNSITLLVGNQPGAVGANLLAIGTRDTGGNGVVLALSGSGVGGVTGAGTSTVSNKISIYVNGNRYYLFASVAP
jgi:hypothetical protein